MCNGSSGTGGSGGSGGSGGGSPGLSSKSSKSIMNKLGISGEKIRPGEIKRNIKSGKITKSDYEKARKMAGNRITTLRGIRRDIYNKTNKNPYQNGTKKQYKDYKEAKKEINNLNKIP